MRLIMFNTLMGVTAGLALLLLPRAWAQLCGQRLPLQLTGRRPFEPAGWAATFAALGVVLSSLGFVMTVTHPLAAAAEHIDTLFGEPSLLLGVLLLAAAWYIGRANGRGLDEEQLRGALAPASWVIAALGVVLLFCAAAIIRFTAVGAAPREEPVTGLLNAYPAVENLFFAIVLYGLGALGCVLFPAAVAGSRAAWLGPYWMWTISGLAFAVFSALNFYTHTGMLININDPGPDRRW